jgi:hypothetical protein
MYHRCEGEPNLNYNGDHLKSLCEKLSYLQILHFDIQVQLYEEFNNQILTDFISTFATCFWLNRPFGCKRVCVNFHQFHGFLQMFSLPYTFNDIPVMRTIDLINAQFNTNEVKINNLSV